jgi:DNA-binding XRE family transcriptional regulator
MTSLQEAREQKNLTVAQLAALSNVAEETINAIESGAQRPSITTALKLSRVLEIPANQIREFIVLLTGPLGGGVDPLLGPRVGP